MAVGGEQPGGQSEHEGAERRSAFGSAAAATGTLEHGETHDELVLGADRLTSVGIDIGTSTSHLMFSQLEIGYRTLHSQRPEVLERKVVSRSPVLLTPFDQNWRIDGERLRGFIEDAFRRAGTRPDQVQTGALIITGEAARKENAREIADFFAEQAGSFVCATAGPRLETVLAAHGSGAVARSREDGLTLLNIDIGGGTTKISLIREGRIEGAMALNIGARLVTYDEKRRIRRIEKDGRRFLDAIGCRLELGDAIEFREVGLLAARMAEALFDIVAGTEAPWPELHVTPPIACFPALDGIVFSGGVSEYLYGRERGLFGDLGLSLGAEVKAEAKRRRHRILPGAEGIRATVIGASQYTVQVTGETIAVPDSVTLPLRNLQIATVRTDWQAPIRDRTADAVAWTLVSRDEAVRGQPFALVVATPAFSGYGAVMELAEGIADALAPLPAAERPAALVFAENIAAVAGGVLSARCMETLCLDEVSLSELDFIDIGNRLPGERYIPVVVKSLVFDV